MCIRDRCRTASSCLNAVSFKLNCLAAICNCVSGKISWCLENRVGCYKTAIAKWSENENMSSMLVTIMSQISLAAVFLLSSKHDLFVFWDDSPKSFVADSLASTSI